MSQALPLRIPGRGSAAENPISRTAYYTLAVRAWDAQLAKPACGDEYAAALMNHEARQIWEQFQSFRNPNASNAARHAIIDDHLREELRRNDRARVVVIGAGFDTRAFRLRGGRWVEVDEPAVVNYKESRLPAARAPNPLTRVSIRFGSDSLAEKLAPYADSEHTHVVLEGVLMYLTHAQRSELLRTLCRCFPNHTVYCDLMRRSFFESYSREVHERIVGIGARFSDMVEQPEQLFAEAGYVARACTSIVLTAAERGTIAIPPFAIRWFLGKLRRGYCIWKWERPAASGQDHD